MMPVMADAIGSLIDTKRFQQPPEVAIIQAFVMQKFQADVSVTVLEKQIILTVTSAALAGSLRPFLWELAQLCGTTKRLSIRIAAV